MVNPNALGIPMSGCGLASETARTGAVGSPRKVKRKVGPCKRNFGHAFSGSHAFHEGELKSARAAGHNCKGLQATRSPGLGDK